MINKTLREHYGDQRGKISDRWELYLKIYDEIFADFREQAISLLEIGVQNGGSLEIWSRYFPDAMKLVGCDINPDCSRLKFDDPRIALVVGDASENDTQSQVLGFSPAYDIIIDDGSHRSSDIVKTFSRYFPHLKYGGIYVVEDLHCSYWSQYEGGLFEPFSSISFFKRLVDVVNFEHWGLEYSRATVLRPILDAYLATLDEVLLSRIHSVEFLNSLCVVRKKRQVHNRLGARVVVGEEAEIVSDPLDRDGDLCERVPQSQLTSPKDPILVADGLRCDVATRDARLSTLSQELVERDEQIVALSRELAERDELIVALDQTMVERDGQIDALTRTVAERDELIVALNQTMVERDGQIDALTRTVAERGARIEVLDQAVIDSDPQIAALRRAIVELKQVESEAQTRVSALLASTSWRVTAPLRALRMRSAHRVSRQVSKAQGLKGAMAGSVRAVDGEFDAEFYLKAYPDIAAAGINARNHYFTYGHREGRLGSPPVPVVHGYFESLDSTKPTALVVSHEASRTGAPILALHIAQELRKKHNVVALVLGGGELIPYYIKSCDVVIGPLEHAHNPVIAGYILAKLIPEIAPTFAIVNSIESRVVLPIFAQLFVPTVCLIHEFASYTRPLHALSDAVFWASEVVFSAAVVRASAQDACHPLRERRPVVLRQGRTIPPQPDWSPLEYESEARRVRRIFRPSSLPDQTVVILGMGSVALRKGVDLFIACAARVASLCPTRPFRFVWIGHGFDPDNDAAYSVYLQDQLRRADLDGRVVFGGEIRRVDVAYESSDLFFLCSRLDPLPNVAIDAAHYQLPIVCFDRTTGIADLLTENGFGELCVAPYLDIEQAAQRLVAFIDSPELRAEVGKGLKELGSDLFDMEAYVERLDQLANYCVAGQAIERQDCILIGNSEVLRADFFLSPMSRDMPKAEMVRTFVRSWASGCHPRKPFPGFHPGIYRDMHGVATEGRNPLADFISSGRPTGAWLCDVIEPSTPVGITDKKLRVALHIHAYYTDLLADVLRRLQGQKLALDLLISVPSQRAADEVQGIANDLVGKEVDIRVVPNRGRDIGPLLTEFGDLILAKYDVIGHVHTKKTADLKDPEIGRVWREFLLENLVGGRHPMAAKIIAMIESDEGLGLIFPDDPNVWGWTENKTIASELATGLELGELADRYFWFPIGTMFWARTQALRPILSAPRSWEDYPEEPLPYDGTVLHAIERLLPLVAKKMGYRIALTNVPGVSR